MSDVRRYGIGSGGEAYVRKQALPDGTYVSAADYDALHAQVHLLSEQNVNLERENAALKGEVEHARAVIQQQHEAISRLQLQVKVGERCHDDVSDMLHDIISILNLDGVVTPAAAIDAVRKTKAAREALEADVAKLKRYPFEPICLICGALKPCMTEADLKPGDSNIPCTFDPTPKELFERCKTLQRDRARLRETPGILSPIEKLAFGVMFLCAFGMFALAWLASRTP